MKIVDKIFSYKLKRLLTFLFIYDLCYHFTSLAGDTALSRAASREPRRKHGTIFYF